MSEPTERQRRAWELRRQLDRGPPPPTPAAHLRGPAGGMLCGRGGGIFAPYLVDRIEEVTCRRCIHAWGEGWDAAPGVGV